MATVVLRPDGAGDETFIPTLTGAPTHWQAVSDESDSSHVGEWSASWSRDLYSLADSSNLGPITNVEVVSRHARSHSVGLHTAYVQRYLKINGNFYPGAVNGNGGVAYTFNSDNYANNPDTGNPWTWAEINAMQIGISLRMDAPTYGWARCSENYIIITYTPVVAPTTTTDPATSVESGQATPNGTLDADGGEACDCGFEWGETPAYGNTTPTQSRTTGQTFAQTITGLDPNKTYHFRAFATNAAGTGHGANRTFTTLATTPTVVANPATDITHAAAALNGELTYDGGEACDCGFEWGLTMAYGNTTPTQSRTTGQTFSQPISGLAPNTPYHFRAFTTNSWGTSYSPDRSFTTLASAPLTTTDPATGLGAVLATINGTLDNDIGEACQCGFEWGLDTGYGTITSTESKTTGETFSQVIGGLAPNTTYHFRAFATNSFGTGYGADRSFTTALVISKAYALAREEL